MTADDQHDDHVEIADVAVDVSELRRVTGRRNVVFEASAHVDIAGVVVELHGLTLRAEPNNRMGCYLPQYRCADGMWKPAISLPAVVERAIARAALEQAGGIVMSEPIKEPT